MIQKGSFWELFLGSPKEIKIVTFAPLRAEWQQRHAHQDQRVTLTLPGGNAVAGHARGVEEDGALVLEMRSGVHRYHSGEISVRADSSNAPKVATRGG